MGVNGDERGVGGDERSFSFGDEGGVTGKIDEINFYRVAAAEGTGPFSVSETGLNRNFSGNFFFVPVGGCSAIRNFAEALSRSSGEK